MLTTRVGDAADAPATARLWTVANVARQAHLGLPLGPVAGAASLPAAEARLRRLLDAPGTILVLGFVPDRPDGRPGGDPGARPGSNPGGRPGSDPGGRPDADPGGDPVAMVLVVQALALDAASTDPLPGVAHVTMVAVDPDQWGRHLAGVVMARAEHEARRAGYARAQLWTQETNHRAHRLYERLGWTAAGRTKIDDHGEQIRQYTREL